MNIAIITGASSGIGEQFLRQIVRERSSFGSVPFNEIWVVARRSDLLETLKTELDPVRIRIFTEDITYASSLNRIRDELSLTKPSVGLLVNCAGVGRTGLFEEAAREDAHNMVALNCSALAELTSICLPYMIPNGDLCSYATGPRIINIASSAGFLPQPGFAVYAATKSFVISFSRAMHAELRRHNIASTTVCPGPVATGFVEKAAGKPGAKTSGFKSLFVVQPEKLVRKSILVSKKGRGLYVYGISQKFLHVASKLLPARFMIFLASHLSKDAKPSVPTDDAAAQVVPDSSSAAVQVPAVAVTQVRPPRRLLIHLPILLPSVLLYRRSPLFPALPGNRRLLRPQAPPKPPTRPRKFWRASEAKCRDFTA